MSVVIDDVASYLEDQGIGTVGSTIFSSYMPDTQSSTFTIAVFDTGGLLPDPYLPTKEPTFQVFVRSNDYLTGKAKVDAIRSSLHQKKNLRLTDGGNYYYFILLQGEGGHIGRNDNGKDEFSMNFRARHR